MPLLEVKNLSVSAKFKNITQSLIHDLFFSIDAGKSLAIVGESGCGKTMTAQALLDLLPENCKATGNVYLNGNDLLDLSTKDRNSLRGKKIILIPQSGYDSLNPVLKVKTHMYETLKRLGIKNRKQQYERSIELLNKAGLEDAVNVMELYPMALSGGMAQKVVFALGLAGDPDLVIADEPTRGSDEEGEEAYIKTLYTTFPNSAIIIITHSLSVAHKCDSVLIMHSGLLMEYGNSKDIFSNVSHPYTRCLINALPENNLKVPLINDYIDNNGCPCYNLCTISTENCKLNIPPLLLKNGVYRRCFHVND